MSCVDRVVREGNFEPQQAAPKDEPAVSTEFTQAEIRDMQRALLALGFNPGGIDGAIGPRTRAAIARFQEARRVPADGQVTLDLFASLQDALSRQTAEADRARRVTSSCAELLAFRDNELPTLWEKIVLQKTVYSEGLQDLRELRRELRNDLYWQAGEWREMMTYVAQTVKTSTRLIGNLLKFSPATGSLLAASQQSLASAQRLYRYLERGESIYNVATTELEKTIYDTLLDMAKNRSYVALSAKTLWDLANDIGDLKAMPGEAAALRSDLAHAIEQIDRQIAALQRELAAADQRVAVEAAIRGAIDLYCGDSVGGMARLP